MFQAENAAQSGELQGVSETKVWASVQGGVEEKPSKVDYGYFLNFYKRAERGKEKIQGDNGKFIRHFPIV